MPPVHSAFRRPGGHAVVAVSAAAAALLASPGGADASADRPSVAVFAPTVAPTVKWRAHVYPVRLQDAVIRGLRATGSPGVMTRSELRALIAWIMT